LIIPVIGAFCFLLILLYFYLETRPRLLVTSDDILAYMLNNVKHVCWMST